MPVEKSHQLVEVDTAEASSERFVTV
jgi:hypothetical protein